ncbi:MAG: SDR family oxidoreductase [Gemmatimonadota bacterium]|nr:SDR family oxidoreductase [Gemmatimonadota bacterium]
MDLGLKDRAALVTGASKGLGRAVAERLAREGADVVINSRSPGALKATASEITRDSGRSVVPVAGDVADETFCAQLVERTASEFGRLDILVANAGGPPPGGVDDFTPEAYRKAVDLNLLSTVQLTLAALPEMRRNGWGRIVAITSVAVKQPVRNLLLSNTARPGVVGFIKTISRDLAAEGILCNVAAPGFIHTARVESLLATQAEAQGTTREAALEAIAADIPAGRIGKPEEFANGVVFLASEAASYITGHTMQIDGGLVQGLL